MSTNSEGSRQSSVDNNGKLPAKSISLLTTNDYILTTAQDRAARSAMCLPMAIEAVAAGDGALRTLMALGASIITKSSAREPSAVTI